MEQGKLPRNRLGGKSVAEQSRVEPGAGAGGDIWNQTQVRGSAEIRGAADRSHGRMNNCATLDSR